MGYLDEKGLEHLWGKIEKRSIPVQALTRAEYDALSEEKKQADVTYIITDDGPAAETDEWYSHRNLLDNWYFANPVNQRGQTEYGQISQYCIDRWKINSDYAYVDVMDGFIRVRGNDVNGYGGIFQLFEQDVIDALKGAYVTASALVKPYTTIRFAGIDVEESDHIQCVSSTFLFNSNGVGISAKAPVPPGEAIMDIYAVKLELGSWQTLAHQDADGGWVLNDPPPDKALELARCQRYFLAGPLYGQKIWSATANAAGFFVPTPVTMRKIPTVIGKLKFLRDLQIDNGFELPSDSGMNVVLRNNGIYFYAYVPSLSMTNIAMISISSDVYLDSNL